MCLLRRADGAKIGLELVKESGRHRLNNDIVPQSGRDRPKITELRPQLDETARALADIAGKMAEFEMSCPNSPKIGS